MPPQELQVGYLVEDTPGSGHFQTPPLLAQTNTITLPTAFANQFCLWGTKQNAILWLSKWRHVRLQLCNPSSEQAYLSIRISSHSPTRRQDDHLIRPLGVKLDWSWLEALSPFKKTLITLSLAHGKGSEHAGDIQRRIEPDETGQIGLLQVLQLLAQQWNMEIPAPPSSRDQDDVMSIPPPYPE
ncbi:hypothetical protein BZG36_00456 [Bifiguratus adelaidae]|uniref:Uncharacterized protein n=1 Tax=Bifiguratus adelaidae TaxID=1938954 RepID=A0A261Y788_9FUNG|nr:hypothetical protein BZG36_00456 [Bifiguratus adelaidae]